jgi:hypothetical protein
MPDLPGVPSTFRCYSIVGQRRDVLEMAVAMVWLTKATHVRRICRSRMIDAVEKPRNAWRHGHARHRSRGKMVWSEAVPVVGSRVLPLLRQGEALAGGGAVLLLRRGAPSFRCYVYGVNQRRTCGAGAI